MGRFVFPFDWTDQFAQNESFSIFKMLSKGEKKLHITNIGILFWKHCKKKISLWKEMKKENEFPEKEERQPILIFMIFNLTFYKFGPINPPPEQPLTENSIVSY